MSFIFSVQRTNLMLLVTPSRTMRIRCTEMSPEFSDLPLEDEDTKVKSPLPFVSFSYFPSFLVLRRPVSVGVKHRWDQDTTVNRTDLVQISVNGRSTSRTYQRYQHVLLTRSIFT